MKGHEYYSQFRYGNWIFCGDEYQRFKYFDGKRVYTTHGRHSPDEEVEEPIPLTPEILEKAGFAQYEWVYILTGEKLSPCGESFKLLDLEDNGHFTHKNVHIQYLHQLQNIYFALSQTELPINL